MGFITLSLMVQNSQASEPIINDNTVTILITSIVVPLALALMNKVGLKPPTQPEVEIKSVDKEPPTNTSAPAPPMYSTPLIFNGDLMSMVSDMWERLQELEKRESSWQRERMEIISHNKMLMSTNVTLSKGLHTFFSWVDNGAQPPPPDVPSEVREIVRIIVEKVEHDEDMK